MCRTIRMKPSDYVTIGHLKGLTFLPDSDLFNYETPENQCYCPAKVTGPVYDEKTDQGIIYLNLHLLDHF